MEIVRDKEGTRRCNNGNETYQSFKGICHGRQRVGIHKFGSLTRSCGVLQRYHTSFLILKTVLALVDRKRWRCSMVSIATLLQTPNKNQTLKRSSSNDILARLNYEQQSSLPCDAYEIMRKERRTDRAIKLGARRTSDARWTMDDGLVMTQNT